MDDKTTKGATCGTSIAGITGMDCISCPLMSTGCVACSPAGMCGLLARGDVWPAHPRRGRRQRPTKKMPSALDHKSVIYNSAPALDLLLHSTRQKCTGKIKGL